MGGLFGLMLGFSLVSFIELFYWVTVRLAANCAHRSGWALLGATYKLEWFKVNHSKKVHPSNIFQAYFLSHYVFLAGWSQARARRERRSSL